MAEEGSLLGEGLLLNKHWTSVILPEFLFFISNARVYILKERKGFLSIQVNSHFFVVFDLCYLLVTIIVLIILLVNHKLNLFHYPLEEMVNFIYSIIDSKTSLWIINVI